MMEENVVAAAGARNAMNQEEMIALIKDIGELPVKRNTAYEVFGAILISLVRLAIGIIGISSLLLGVSMSKEATLTHASIQGVQIPVIYEHSALIPAGIVRLVFQGGGKLQDGELIGRGAVIEELLEKGEQKARESRLCQSIRAASDYA